MNEVAWPMRSSDSRDDNRVPYYPARPKVYLSGPIAWCSKDEVRGWRDQFRNIWGPRNCVDPSKRIFQDTADNWSKTKDIVQLDLADMGRSDVHLIYYQRPTTGTLMESVYPFLWGKFCIVACVDQDTLDKLSPWLFYHTHKQCVGLGPVPDLIYEHFDL